MEITHKEISLNKQPKIKWGDIKVGALFYFSNESNSYHGGDLYVKIDEDTRVCLRGCDKHLTKPNNNSLFFLVEGITVDKVSGPYKK